MEYPKFRKRATTIHLTFPVLPNTSSLQNHTNYPPNPAKKQKRNRSRQNRTPTRAAHRIAHRGTKNKNRKHRQVRKRLRADTNHVSSAAIAPSRPVPREVAHTEAPGSPAIGREETRLGGAGGAPTGDLLPSPGPLADRLASARSAHGCGGGERGPRVVEPSRATATRGERRGTAARLERRGEEVVVVVVVGSQPDSTPLGNQKKMANNQSINLGARREAELFRSSAPPRPPAGPPPTCGRVTTSPRPRGATFSKRGRWAKGEGKRERERGRWRPVRGEG